MAKQQILILENLGISKAQFQTIIKEKNINFDFVEKKGKEDSNLIIGIICVKTNINQELISQYKNLKFIAVAFTGFDNIDMQACRKNQIAVFNVPAYATDSVAELTLGLAISLLREIPQTQLKLRPGEWNHPAGLELKSKKIGIIGTGSIGIRVAELFHAFGCMLFAWSRSEHNDFINLGGVYLDSLEELAQKVDILSIHIPQSTDSIDIINSNILNKMKPTAFLINTARGPIVNQNDLSKALNDGVIAGAAIDVFNQEPISQSSSILEAKNTILTPHIAYKTEEALFRRANITLNNIKRFFEGKDINRVDKIV